MANKPTPSDALLYRTQAMIESRKGTAKNLREGIWVVIVAIGIILAATNHIDILIGFVAGVAVTGVVVMLQAVTPSDIPAVLPEEPEDL